jgi:glycine oxidase
MRVPDVVIVGAGIIGLATAWRLSQAGLSVRVHDPAPGSGASTVAAGMLAPVGETHYENAPLLPLLRESAAAWPGFAAELAAASGRNLGYRSVGTLAVAGDADAATELDREAAYRRSLGLAVEPVTGSAARTLEPLLAPRVRAGLRLDADHQVDPRRTVDALLSVVDVERSAVPDTAAGTVVIAAGWRTGGLTGLPIRPVKGQLLRLRAPDGVPRLSRVVRGAIDGRTAYLVPRDDGELVVGATSEERGTDTTVTAGAVHDLLRAAVDLVPVLAEYRLAETCAGLRPGTPDNLPVLGRLDACTVVASGHYRNGILLAPATATALTELVLTGEPPTRLAPFDPHRFEDRHA